MQAARMYVDERDKTHQLCIGSDRCIFPPALFVSDGIQLVYWVQRVLIQLTVLHHTARWKYSFKCSVLNIAAFPCVPAGAAFKVESLECLKASISDNHAFKHLIKQSDFFPQEFAESLQESFVPLNVCTDPMQKDKEGVVVFWSHLLLHFQQYELCL